MGQLSSAALSICSSWGHDTYRILSPNVYIQPYPRGRCHSHPTPAHPQDKRVAVGTGCDLQLFLFQQSYREILHRQTRNALNLEAEPDSICAVLWDDCTWAGTQNYISSGTSSSIMHTDMVWDLCFSTESEGRVPHSESPMPYPAALCCSFGSKKG